MDNEICIIKFNKWNFSFGKLNRITFGLKVLVAHPIWSGEEDCNLTSKNHFPPLTLIFALAHSKLELTELFVTYLEKKL